MATTSCTSAQPESRGQGPRDEHPEEDPAPRMSKEMVRKPREQQDREMSPAVMAHPPKPVHWCTTTSASAGNWSSRGSWTYVCSAGPPGARIVV
eukprot:scaffold30733_cov129-Isochrysis_galbana.AAC.5